MRYVPSTVVIGPNGRCVTRGYTEIGGLRLYDDQVVVGENGQHVVSKGWVEIPQERLGPEFERVLYDNLWELYARD